MQECKAKTTSSEFVDWQKYFRQENNEVTPDRYYLAQIALETARNRVKEPAKLKLKDFIIEFISKKSEPVERTPEEKKAASMHMLEIWKARLMAMTKKKKDK